MTTHNPVVCESHFTSVNKTVLVGGKVRSQNRTSVLDHLPSNVLPSSEIKPRTMNKTSLSGRKMMTFHNI